MDRAIAAACHLMQRAQRQSASRQTLVDRLDAEGQHQCPSASCDLEPPDARAKFLDIGTGKGRIHGLGKLARKNLCS